MTKEETTIAALLLTKVKVVKLEADEFTVLAEGSISAVCGWLDTELDDKDTVMDVRLALVQAAEEHPGEQIGVVLREDGLTISIF